MRFDVSVPMIGMLARKVVIAFIGGHFMKQSQLVAIIKRLEAMQAGDGETQSRRFEKMVMKRAS